MNHTDRAISHPAAKTQRLDIVQPSVASEDWFSVFKEQRPEYSFPFIHPDDQETLLPVSPDF